MELKYSIDRGIGLQDSPSSTTDNDDDDDVLTSDELLFSLFFFPNIAQKRHRHAQTHITRGKLTDTRTSFAI